MRPGSRQDGTAVPCWRLPWRVHALRPSLAIARCRKKFLDPTRPSNVVFVLAARMAARPRPLFAPLYHGVHGAWGLDSSGRISTAAPATTYCSRC